MAFGDHVNGSTSNPTIFQILLAQMREEMENEEAANRTGGDRPAAVRTDGAGPSGTKPVPPEPQPSPYGRFEFTPFQISGPADGAGPSGTKPIPPEPQPAPYAGFEFTPIQIDESEPESENGDLVIRGARHGYKRELEFAIQSLTEIGTSMLAGPRTRNKKVRISDGGDGPSAQMDGQDPSDVTGRSSRALVPFWSPDALSIECPSESEEDEMPYSPNGSKTNTSASKKILSNKKVSAGRLTKKHVSLHKLVFTSDLLPDGTELNYIVKKKIKGTGIKKGLGIMCCCCSTLMSPTQFEAHHGHAQRRKPYNYIYIEGGISLHELAVRLSETRDLSNAENDDLCNICADGGDLVCCDLCPRAFHLECLDLSNTPDGKWHCPSCLKMHQREKYVERNGNARAAGRIPGVDPIEEILKRRVRIVKTPEIDVGGCVFCRKHECSTSGFGPSTVLLCDQCDKEHHVGCLKVYNKGDFKELPEAAWFCCSDCSTIYTTLHELLLRGAQPVPDLALDIVNSKRKKQGLMINSNIELRWRLLSGNMEGDEKDLLLAKTLSIFHESFDPIMDPATGMDLIPPMVFGSKFSEEWDYSGIYCAILTEGFSVITAGLVRVLGTEVAEVPLVATRTKSQGLGYFQALFSCVERLLILLKVKHLLLHAAEEAESIWKTKFGFTNITSSQLQDYAKGVKTMVFEGTSMLHKQILNN